MNEIGGELNVPRIILAVAVSIHALIHLIGVAREWGLAEVGQFGRKTLVPIEGAISKVSGFLWLLAFLCFIAAATGLFFTDLWWIPGLTGVVISQLLVIVYWQDAKAGTVLNVVMLIVCLAGYGRWSFVNSSRLEALEMIRIAGRGPAGIVTGENLKHLPPPVQRWLNAAGVVGKTRVQTVHLGQRGLMRTDPEGSWMPAEAQQVFTVNEPGFIWTVDVTMAGLIPVSGRDRYRDGRGTMLIKAFSLLPIVNGSGTKIDQGTLLRYLGEIIWFPSAALSPTLEWTPVDSSSAQATMTFRDVSATAVFQIDEAGNVVSCSADRYMGDGDAATLERWYIQMREWKALGGLNIPTSGDVTWKLSSGDFTYYRWEILQIQYDSERTQQTIQ